MNKTIVAALVILAVLLVVYIFSTGEYVSTKPKAQSEGYERLKDVDFEKVGRLILTKGERDDGEAASVVLEKKDGTWVVASAYGYPANQEKVEKIIKELGALSEIEVAGRSPDSHVDFKVDEKNGAVITLFNAEGKQLGKLVVGDTARGGNFDETKVYVRFGDEDLTFRAPSDIRSEASLWSETIERKSYLETKLVSLEDDEEVVSARVIRPGKDDLLVERRWKEVPVETPEEKNDAGAGTDDGSSKDNAEDAPEEEKEPETKREEYFVVTSGTETHEVDESKKWPTKSFVDRGRSMYVEDAADPDERAAQGLDAPQMKIVFTYRKKEPASAEPREYTLLFGNAIKDDEGKDKEYYLTLQGVDSLEGKVYTMLKWNFDSLNKELKDFLPEPKKDVEGEDKGGAEAKEEKAGEETPSGAPAADTESAGAQDAGSDGGAGPAPEPPQEPPESTAGEPAGAEGEGAEDEAPAPEAEGAEASEAAEPAGAEAPPSAQKAPPPEGAKE